MAEDWEDWENDDFTPQLPAATPQTAVADDDLEASKFAGEDEEEEKPQYNVPKPQQVRNQALAADVICTKYIWLISGSHLAAKSWQKEDV